MTFINIHSRQCGRERNNVGNVPVAEEMQMGVNKVKEMIIYVLRLLVGAIRETCNIVVGLAVTEGKMECACFAQISNSH